MVYILGARLVGFGLNLGWENGVVLFLVYGEI